MNEFLQLAESVEFQALRESSARIGSNPEYVQGPGGNTSLKSAKAMWIKASGTWLADAVSSDIMVPVALDGLLQAIKEQDSSAESSLDYVVEEYNPSQLRPSIETTVHAVMPGAVVLHDHCVETIALAVRHDAEQETARLLGDMGAVFVPYTKPGLRLACSILGAITPDTRVVVLGNHGLIVSADTVADAEALLIAVAARLRGRLHAEIEAHDQLGLLTNGLAYQLAPSNQTHAVAQDPKRLEIALNGALYPDHVIFLGRRTASVRKGQSVADSIEKSVALNGVEPVLLLVEGMGALIHDKASAAQKALVQCLGDVLARVELNAALTTLSEEQTNELLNWDAEKYRQSLDK